MQQYYRRASPRLLRPRAHQAVAAHRDRYADNHFTLSDQVPLDWCACDFTECENKLILIIKFYSVKDRVELTSTLTYGLSEFCNVLERIMAGQYSWRCGTSEW
jgi:hypothetical protein